MGGRNQQCLMALKKYIEDESIDKRKQTLDTSHWVLECVQVVIHVILHQGGREGLHILQPVQVHHYLKLLS